MALDPTKVIFPQESVRVERPVTFSKVQPVFAGKLERRETVQGFRKEGNFQLLVVKLHDNSDAEVGSEVSFVNLLIINMRR